jgi:hypothetical protein
MQFLSAKYVFSPALVQLIFTDFGSMMQDSTYCRTIFGHILRCNILFANAISDVLGFDYKRLFTVYFGLECCIIKLVAEYDRSI